MPVSIRTLEGYEALFIAEEELVVVGDDLCQQCGKTEMSSLPPEIFDLIVDFLHDEPETLKACCIASKAWIYRTRRHLFNHVKFHPRGRHVSHWGETFPDPAQNSPAHHAQILSIGLSKLITAADINTLLTFCRISHLNVDTLRWHHQPFSLLPLHAFFPTIRSLHLRFSSGQVPKILGLICSFLDLDDLALVGYDSSSRGGAWSTPSISPRLAGSLELRGGICIQPITRDLLDFPNGLQFKKIVVGWSALGAVESTVELVSRCSDTLEYLKITNFRQGTPLFGHIVQLMISQTSADRSVQEDDTRTRPLKSDETQGPGIWVQKS